MMTLDEMELKFKEMEERLEFLEFAERQRGHAEGGFVDEVPALLTRGGSMSFGLKPGVTYVQPDPEEQADRAKLLRRLGKE
jgi:hypothetical protein